MQAVPVPTPPLAKRRPDVPVEVLAARTLSLATLGPQRRAERRQESVAELEALAGASLLELRQKLPTRYWVVGMLSLMGKSMREIAALVGYAGSAPVVRVLRHPAVLRLSAPLNQPCPLRAAYSSVSAGSRSVQDGERKEVEPKGVKNGPTAEVAVPKEVTQTSHGGLRLIPTGA